MLNFHKFLHTMYKYVLNSVVKISVTFVKRFEYYTIILRGRFFRGHAVVLVPATSGEQIFNCYRSAKKCLEPTIMPKLSVQYY